MTYYIWNAELRPWRGGILKADMLDFAPDWFRIDNWSCGPVDVPIPIIDFNYPRTAPRLDLIFSGTSWEPYSPRLRSLLREVGASFEEFPCRIRDKRTGEVLTDEYAAVHIMDCKACFDWDGSDYDVAKSHDGSRFPSRIRRLVLKDGCLEAGYPIFRLKEARHIVLVHERVRELLLARGISGVSFSPLEHKYGF